MQKHALKTICGTRTATEDSGLPTCAVGWRWNRVVLLFFYKLESDCAEVALVLNNQVTESNNQLLSKTETLAGQTSR